MPGNIKERMSVEQSPTLRKHYRDRKGGTMSRDRKKNREKAWAHKEERLDGKNAYGINDPTPREAVARIIKERKGYVKEQSAAASQ